MIDVLLSGRLRGAPALKTASNGKPFAAFRVAASDRNGASLLCSCIAFSVATIEAVQRLDDGDSLAVTGEATPTTWPGNDGKPRLGLDVLAHGVLTAYHLGRKRKKGAVEEDHSEGEPT